MSASPAQIDFLDKLYAERVVPDEVRELVAAKARVLAPRDFSKIIDIVKGLPRRQTLQPGLYLVGDGVYEVKKSQYNRLYAKRLDTQLGKFVYDADALVQLPLDSQPITVEQALDFGLRNGICIKGHPLTDPLSVRLGIGPTCCKTLFGMTQRQLLAEREAQVVAV